jgi:hypothetical protein
MAQPLAILFRITASKPHRTALQENHGMGRIHRGFVFRPSGEADMLFAHLVNDSESERRIQSNSKPRKSGT